MTIRTERLKEAPVKVPVGAIALDGDLAIPENTQGVVLFGHGSGSSLISPGGRYVAAVLQDAGLATLLFDLPTKKEEPEDLKRGHLRFNISFQAGRLVAATMRIDD
ncbi:MAG: hypothetical protein HY730_09755 [Candidatus Tectomicrobia bacterium]|uniref:Hydrolase n=1 Tax=Tectimicrobiota bacterium TaxID=2528274 RepID=A0A933LQY5_UNCTE|nr:hypothetical protein [Candidatus Tectomicrobia bacterium]